MRSRIIGLIAGLLVVGVAMTTAASTYHSSGVERPQDWGKADFGN